MMTTITQVNACIQPKQLFLPPTMRLFSLAFASRIPQKLLNRFPKKNRWRCSIRAAEETAV